MGKMISSATTRNWEKLRIEDTKQKLQTRANKRLSSKAIIPVEYITNTENLVFLNKLVNNITEHKWRTSSVMYTLGILYLKQKELYGRNHVLEALNEYHYDMIPELLNVELPDDEWDILGLIYQCLLVEGRKNQKGSYYTPSNIVISMTTGIDFSNGRTIFDPCCGSGSFFLGLEQVAPNQIFGYDNDSIAVMIAKINLLVKFKNYVFKPNIYEADFLANDLLSGNNLGDVPELFDYVITNPPWGAMPTKRSVPEISSGETFSNFLVLGYSRLKMKGTLKYLLPESILNVKSHKDIRCFLLEHGRLESITIYNNTFSGVLTSFISVELVHMPSSDIVKVVSDRGIRTVARRTFYETENVVFNLIDDIDLEIVQNIKSKGEYTLAESTWALGIVTGDNEGKLKDTYIEGYEPIYTGKEIQRYTLKKAKKFIRYDRSQLQQVAKDEYYRAPEKLVYKFISNRLVFAYDNTSSLFLNSANVLIPHIPNMSIMTVMAFLNSELYQYLYLQMFGEIKILKGNLIELPFPKITIEEDEHIHQLTNCIIAGDIEYIDELQFFIYNIFGLSEKHILRIKEVLHGKTNG